MAVGMTKAVFTPCAMSPEYGETLPEPLFLVFLAWRMKVGSKCTRLVDIWGWRDQGILASRNG